MRRPGGRAPKVHPRPMEHFAERLGSAESGYGWARTTPVEESGPSTGDWDCPPFRVRLETAVSLPVALTQDPLCDAS